MYSDSFANKLRRLMKERKISGQKIGNAIGTSQKTISRYCTGDSVPSVEVQKKILQVIAELGGHPEDANMQNAFPMSIATLREASRFNLFPVAQEDEILEMEMQELYRDIENACKVYSLLTESNQQFVLDNLDVYINMDIYEIAIVEYYTMLSTAKKKFILDSLETFHLSYNFMKDSGRTCGKMAKYMEMMLKCKQIQHENTEKFVELPEHIIPSQYTQEYIDKLKIARGIDVEKMGDYLAELITFDAKDWYLLFLIQIFSLNDRGVNRVCDGAIVGDKLFSFIKYIEKLAEEDLYA